MKGRFWRKALAAALALLVVSGNVPIRSVSDLFGGEAITASAEESETSGQCGENAFWSFDTATSKLTISGTGAMYNYKYDAETGAVTSPWYNYADSIISVEIENGITSIGNQAFQDCTSLTSITIPDSVTSIGNQALEHCTSLTSITIPDSVTSIGVCMFQECTSLTSVTIPDSVTSIGVFAFQECTSLTSITIPDSVTSIGADAFYLCQNITDVYCYADPKNLTWDEYGCDDFNEDGLTVCHVREEHIDTYKSEKFSDVNVKFQAEAMDKCGDHAYWCFESKTRKLTISGTGDMADYEYDDETDTVNSPWFVYKDNITSVEIEYGVTSIGDFAFEDCTDLNSVTIPNSVTGIGEWAFYVCTRLESITIPEKVTSIGKWAFVGCTGLTSITIPASVTSIGGWAFAGCTSLTSVTIPDSVTSIGTDAFYDCTNITDVYCYAAPANLTWDEFGCDDFIKSETGKPTICHVREEYLGKYNEKFGSSVNVTFVGDLDAVDMELGEHLYGHSITLDGSIGVNFYVELTDELLASDTAAMVFTVPNGSKTDTQTLLVKDVIAESSNKVVIGSKTYYKFKCSISAKDMASEITAQLVDGESKGKEYTYSVKDYADYLLAHTEVEQYEKAAPLVKAMLNYGAASQTYFGIEGTAANASLTDADKALGEVSDLDTFELDNNVALPEGVTFEGATLSLKSETTLSLYFKGLPAETVFTCDVKTVETAKNGEYVVARIRGIKASELQNDFTVTFEDDSVTYNVTYNVMTYCYNVLNDGKVDDNLKNVCKALYKYAQAAKTYSE